MHPPNEELHRYPRNGVDPDKVPAAGSSSWGGLTVLLFIVVLMSGLIVYSSLSTPPAQPPTPAVDTEAPDSITSTTGAGTE
ncbi:MAG: hypothetical protein ACQEVT_02990 [Pseudomonadota bacterium]|uniref:hypothetical protein n=1 Tax=Roseovarius TaxID=74030 RepID=UPI0022A753F7|nr:hypothetical protein [Roseovarius sp. EGI FJ00037]MCZ0811413.1 hypothetical protein [Roseovarius sp. EGI FJ00037]